MSLQPQAGFRHELALDLPAVHRGARVARYVVRTFARLEGLSSREVETVMLAVSELLANAIDHGGGGAAMTESQLEADVRMRLVFQVRDKEWRLEVTDQGSGDPAQIQKLFSDELPDLSDDRGRGLFLIGQMLDRVDVERGQNGRGVRIIATRAFGT